jgi:hypothetical protein
MGSLNSLHVEVETASRCVRANGCIAGIGERACLSTAEAGYIVLVAAEGLILGRPVEVLLR